MRRKDILLIYDNATSHTGKISDWWMRNTSGYKVTIPPYTPEFNPIERFFNTLKIQGGDGIRRNNLDE